MNHSRNRNVFVVVVLLIVVFFFVRSKNERPVSEPVSNVAEADPITPSIEVAAEKISRVEQIRVPASVEPDGLTIAQIEELRGRAKGRLASAYTAQSAYFAEYGRYSTDLMAMGWAPSDATMAFKVGYLEAYVPKSDEGFSNPGEKPERMTSDIFLGATGDSEMPFYEYDETVKTLNLRNFEKYCEFKCTATTTGFEFLMLVPLGNSNNVDVWIVNAAKEMRLVRDGMAEPLDIL